ncbi:MAG: class I adenylate-forming enzyme family protein [Acidimicrobiales bacterium]
MSAGVEIAWAGGSTPAATPPLPAIWAARWAAAGAAPALVVDRVAHTYDELDHRTRTAAGRLAGVGLGRGDRLLWSAGPSLDAITVALAALRIGAVLVPFSPALTEREVGVLAGDARPRAAVVDREGAARSVAGAAPATLLLGPDLLPLADARPRGLRSVPPVGAAEGAGAVLDSVAPGDPAMIVYTSGTTGRPKGAVLSHRNLAAGVAAVASAWQWTGGDRLVLALPLFHVHGLCIGLLGTLATGASAVALDRFEAATVLDAAADERGSLFFGVPTMYHRLVASGRAAELGRLRLCVAGSAPLPATLWSEVRRVAGIEVLERYGMSETLLTLANPYDGERRPGTVGLPLPGVSARLDDGELLVAGPSVFGGYWGRPAADAECFVDGWFRTGDLAAVSADGYYTILGRRGDVIITGGHNVYPAEVEDALLGHPSVGEVAVAGRPSEEWGEAVTAWVVPAAAVSEQELLAFAAGRLAPYKRPRRVHFVDSLPKNAMGKVQRDRLD